ncbi:ADP-ribosylation factor-like protein [Operophtera brumata]|uniref:ADP-ribosylation factor-like protein n=1 Tax=Operophtera brumata TaxID=104452 RepID=A0A0L7LN45_OPEBR|nr:ADP-ribosylation factor-like protein [Operophtera brumata]
MYAGSVYDGIKVSKMDEFDMYVVIRLPINYYGICVELDQPGFVKLRITNAFDNLDKQPGWEGCHKMKKLRDGLEMRSIASYYIKTLFLWEIHNNKDKSFWQNKISVCFKHMLDKFHSAIVNKRIPYFWHEDNNLIKGLKPTLLKVYADKLKDVLDAMNSNDVDKVVAAILTVDELQKFKESEVYQSHQRVAGVPKQVAESSQPSPCMSEAVKALNDEIDSARNGATDDKMVQLEQRVKDLEDRLSAYEDLKWTRERL